jgi:outer membrane protein insertion porin family
MSPSATGDWPEGVNTYAARANTPTVLRFTRKKGFGLFAGLTLSLAGLSPAQTSSFEGKSILELRYEPSPQPLTAPDLERLQLLRVGAPLRSSEVAETIDRLFATGRYQDIQVDAESRGDGVVVVFLTQSNRFVEHVSTVGKIVNPPNAGQIVSAAQLELGSRFQPDALSTAEKNIQQLFTSNGFYEAKAHLETVDDPEHQQVNVHIVIDPGKRARYERPAVLGDTKLPDATIIRATGWRMRFIGRWRHVTEALTRKGKDGVEKAYQGRDRLAASVNLKSLTYDPEIGRVQPTLDIDAGPRIQVKALEGKVSKRLLKRYVPVYQEGAVDQDLLVEGARNLRDYFQVKGYPDVDVTFREPPPENDRRTIEYFISRGPRQKLVQVEIQGNKYFDTDTLRERMFLEPSSLRFRWGRFSEAFLKKDEETIADLYKANGFRDVRVTSALTNSYRGNAGHIAATFSIREGPQWKVAHLELEGIEHLHRDSVLARLSSSDGQPYSDVSVAADRSSIMTLYYSNGFRQAAFEWSATPASEPYQVNLRYKLSEGGQEFVRDVLMSGLKTTRLGLVQRTVNLTPGDALSLPRNRQAERRLYDLGIFAKIDTAVQNSEGEETQKYVLYDFEEAHRYNVNVGVGAELARFGGPSSDLSTPSGATGISPRLSVNVNRLNTLGLGHTVSLQTRLSNLEQRLALSYLDPKLYNAEGRTLTFTGLYDISRDVRTFSSRREEGSVQLSQKLSKPTTIFFRFAYRRVSTNDVVIPALLVPQLLQPVRIGIFSGNLVQDRRDNPADAHRGIYNAVEAGLASSIFGSQRSFTRILARNATYHRIGKNWVLARQLTFGAILPFQVPSGLASSDSVPLPERFFGGGSVSHRGFPQNQGGPRDIGSPAGPGGTATQPTGFPLGGNAQLFSNIEARFPLLGDNIGGVFFHDAGNVYRGIGDISLRFHQNGLKDFNYMVHAVGFGIRYKTPIGPIRGDLAYSINPPRFNGFKGTLQDLLQCNPSLPPEQTPAACQGVPQSISHFQFFFSIGQTF